MADNNYTLQVNHQTEDGKDVPVTISVPKDKLTFTKGKLVDADIDYLMGAAKQVYDSARNPNEAGIGAPKVNAPMSPINKYKGMRVLPEVSSKGSIIEKAPDIGHRFWEGIKSGASGIMSTIPGHAGGEIQPPISEEQRKHPFTTIDPQFKNPEPTDFALNDLPIISDIDRLRRGDIAGEVGQLLPSVMGNAALSPKVRAGASGGARSVYNNLPEMKRYGTAGMIGAGVGYLAHPGYTGIMGGSLVGGAVEALLEGGIRGGKGAIQAAKSKPWIAPDVLESLSSFIRNDPGQPSPVLLPEQSQFNMPSRTIPPEPLQLNAGPEAAPVRPMLGSSSQFQMPPAETSLQEMNKGFQQFPNNAAGTVVSQEPKLLESGPQRVFNMPGPEPLKALPAPGGDTRTLGALPMPQAVDLNKAIKINPNADLEFHAPTPEEIGQKLVPNVRREAMRSQGAEQPQLTSEQAKVVAPEKKSAPVIEMPKRAEEPAVIPKAPDKKLTWSKVQTFTYKRPSGTTVSDIQEHFGATGEETQAILSEMKDEGMVHNKGGKWYEGKEKQTPKVNSPEKKEAPKVESPKVEPPKKEAHPAVAQDPAADEDVKIPEEKTIRLYRGESSMPPKELPEWLKGSETDKARGRWFAGTEDQARWYTRPEQAGEGGGKISFIDIPANDIEKYKVSNQSGDVQKFSRDPENEYFIPEEIAKNKKYKAPDLIPELQAKYDRRNALQKRMDSKEVLSNKEFKEWEKLDNEIIQHEKTIPEEAKPEETEETPTSNAKGEQGEGSEISVEELYKIADALGVKPTPLGAFLEKRYKVAPSKFGNGKWGFERMGKKDLNSLLDTVGEKKLANILELMGKISKK